MIYFRIVDIVPRFLSFSS